MKLTVDRSADAAYINLNEENISVAKTYPCDPSEVNGMINLDFDSEGHLVGIEILDASKKLNKKILDNAELI